MAREIITDWTMSSGSGHMSVTYWDTNKTALSQRNAWATFLGSVQQNLSSTCTWSIRTAGRELEDSSGFLTGAWTENTPKSGAGTVGTPSVPDASMVLYQWKTNVIADHRFLRGRTFIPSLAASNLTAGNITPAVVTGLNGYAITLLAANAGLLCWHRPIVDKQTGVILRSGSVAAVNASSVWPELAVLRRRRG